MAPEPKLSEIEALRQRVAELERQLAKYKHKVEHLEICNECLGQRIKGSNYHCES